MDSWIFTFAVRTDFSSVRGGSLSTIHSAKSFHSANRTVLLICRWDQLDIVLWKDHGLAKGETISLKVNGQPREIRSGQALHLHAGERVTLVPGVYHEFFPATEECIIGGISTANDDLHDNFFVNTDVGRFPGVEEDEAPLLKLVNDRA